MCKKIGGLDHQSRRVLIWHEKETAEQRLFSFTVV